MNRLVTFLKRKPVEPSLEDVIALNSAQMALQVRVEQMMRQSSPVAAY